MKNLIKSLTVAGILLVGTSAFAAEAPDSVAVSDMVGQDAEIAIHMKVDRNGDPVEHMIANKLYVCEHSICKEVDKSVTDCLKNNKSENRICGIVLSDDGNVLNFKEEKIDELENYVSADGTKVFQFPSPFAMRDEVSFLNGKLRPDLQTYDDMMEGYGGELVPMAMANKFTARALGARNLHDYSNLSFSYDKAKPEQIQFKNHDDNSYGFIANGYIVHRFDASGEEKIIVPNDETQVVSWGH